MIHLYDHEQKINEVTIDVETFIVTNKRLIYKRYQEKSIGISNIRECQFHIEDFKIYKYNFDAKALSYAISIIASVLTVMYFMWYFYEDGEVWGSIFGALFGCFFGIAVGFICHVALYAILASVQAFSATKTTRVIMQIVLHDGTMWFRNDYPIVSKVNVEKITSCISDQIYR